MWAGLRDVARGGIEVDWRRISGRQDAGSVSGSSSLCVYGDVQSVVVLIEHGPCGESRLLVSP